MREKMEVKVSHVDSNTKSDQVSYVRSNECNCKKDHKSDGHTMYGNKSNGYSNGAYKNEGQKSSGNKSCGKRVDPAVEAMQQAGNDLSDIFKQLKNENVSERLVKAIRCRDARTVQSILDCHCRVVSFFCTRESDCVKVCCSFGRYNDVHVTFDICVKRPQNQCNRRSAY